MKKSLLAAALLLAFGTFTIAQDATGAKAPAKAAKTAPAKTVTPKGNKAQTGKSTTADKSAGSSSKATTTTTTPNTK